MAERPGFERQHALSPSMPQSCPSTLSWGGVLLKTARQRRTMGVEGLYTGEPYHGDFIPFLLFTQKRCLRAMLDHAAWCQKKSAWLCGLGSFSCGLVGCEVLVMFGLFISFVLLLLVVGVVLSSRLLAPF